MKPTDSNNDSPNFQLPEGYFEQFQAELETQIALEKALGKKVNTGFSTPQGYFDTFEMKMDTLSRKRTPLPQEQAPKVISIVRKQWLWTATGIAAMIIVAISIFPWSTAEENDFDSLEIAEIQEYVTYQELAFSDYELGDLLTDDAVTSLENTDFVGDAALIEYLENNTEDTAIFLE